MVMQSDLNLFIIINVQLSLMAAVLSISHNSAECQVMRTPEVQTQTDPLHTYMLNMLKHEVSHVLCCIWMNKIPAGLNQRNL